MPASWPSLLRAGLLTEVTIPEEEMEAMRDLERARDDAKNAERAVRHQLERERGTSLNGKGGHH